MRWLHGPLGLATALVALLSINPGLLRGQVAPRGLAAGIRVRVRPASPPATWVYGSLLQATGDSVHLYTSGVSADTLHFAAADLERLELSQGRRGRAGHGAVLGAAIGAGAGLVLGIAAAAEDCDGDCFFEVGPGEVVAVMALLGATGAGIGALIGLASRGEQWASVPQPWLTGRVSRSAGVTRVGLQVPW